MKQYISRLKGGCKTPVFILWWILRLCMLTAFAASLASDAFTLSQQLHIAVCFIGSFMWEISLAMPRKSLFRFMPSSIHTVINIGFAASAVLGVYLDMYYTSRFFDPILQAFFSFISVLYGYEIAYSFIAGLMHHIKAITVLTNPIVNSYKRLVPGYEAPVYIAWSAKNRSPLIRIPTARGSGTRVELRNPDPSANPYLAMAAVIQAGLDGVEKAMTPPPPKDSNIFDLTAEQRKAADIHSLPKNLREAAREFKYSDFAKYAVGEHVHRKYFEAKQEEWQEYTTRVSQWEIDKYLGKY